VNTESHQIDWLRSERVPVTPGFPERLVILDCETTGGKPTFHRIIEVGLAIVEHGEIVQRWQSLVDPGTPLPVAISQLTGIDEDMLAGAPTFAQIAETLLQHLDGRVLVAHNARFDHAFLKNEFARIGISFRARLLCSVKLSRRLFPQQRRHSLDAIVRRLGLSVENRHRALDDALAVWQFFLRIGESIPVEEIANACDGLLQRPALPPQLDPAEVDRLPNAPGVYYFHDAAGQLLYIGKSVNLRDRVMSHFNQDYRNPKDLRINTSLAHIDFETTASDLGAQLLESRQIKALSPLHNRRLQRLVRLYEYQLQPNDAGYLQVSVGAVEHVDPGTELSGQFGLFRSRKQALKRLEQLARDFLLCHRLTGLESDRGAESRPCFARQLKRCLGACCGEESPESYNERLTTALADYRTRTWPWPDAILVEERGNPPAEPAWHLMHAWRYLGQLKTLDELYERGYAAAEGQVNSTTADPGRIETPESFDLDTYLILTRFLLQPRLMRANGIRIHPLTRVDSVSD